MLCLGMVGTGYEGTLGYRSWAGKNDSQDEGGPDVAMGATEGS